MNTNTHTHTHTHTHNTSDICDVRQQKDTYPLYQSTSRVSGSNHMKTKTKCTQGLGGGVGRGQAGRWEVFMLLI